MKLELGIPQETDVCRSVAAGSALYTRPPYVFVVAKTSARWFPVFVQGAANVSIHNHPPITAITGAADVLTSFLLRLLDYLADLTI